MGPRRLASITTIVALAFAGATAASASATPSYAVPSSPVTGTLAAGTGGDSTAQFTTGTIAIKCTTSTGSIPVSPLSGTLPATFTFSSNPTFSGCTASISGAPKAVSINTTIGSSNACPATASTIAAWNIRLNDGITNPLGTGDFLVPQGGACVIVGSAPTRCYVNVGSGTGTGGAAVLADSNALTNGNVATELYVKGKTVPVAVRAETGGCPTGSTSATFTANGTNASGSTPPVGGGGKYTLSPGITLTP